jgi:hypothetical protein
VLANPEARVWFVEGEKAVDACTDKGLVAVSLPGGASQQRFGNALDPLLERDVILWADNDDAGRALMQRVAGYLPNARTVTPAVAPKGDAYDYFASGGSVAALEEALRSLEPVVRIVGPDDIVYEHPVSGGSIQFAFSQFSAKGRDTDAFMVVKVDYPGFRGSDYSTHLNLSSVSNRNSIRLELEKVYDEKALGWPKVMASATSSVERAWKSVDASIDMYDVAPLVERRWLVERWAPENATTCPFGPGGAGKSFLALDVMLHCLHGEPWMDKRTTPIKSFGLVDYEDREDEWRLRLEQLSRPHGWELEPGQFQYIPGRGIPLVDQGQQLVALAQKYGWGGLIVDSAVSAVGGLVKDEQAVARLCNFLSDMGRHGVTVLLLAHNTKDDDTRYPLGSIYWHNLVRGTHYIEHHQVDGSLELDWLIWNRKSNRGKQRPVSARVTFPELDSGSIRIAPVVGQANAVTQERPNRKQEVLDALRNRGRDSLASELTALVEGMNTDTVRAHLNSLMRDGKAAHGAKIGVAQYWRSVETRYDQAESLSKGSERSFESETENGGSRRDPLSDALTPSWEEEQSRLESLAGG